MSRTLDRISREQFGQTFVRLSDADFVDGVFRLSEYAVAVVCELTIEAAYTLHFAPAGVSDGQVCSVLLTVGEDTTLLVKADGETLFNLANGTAYAVMFCDGRTWLKVWDQAILNELIDRQVIPTDGEIGDLLARTEGDGGPLVWETVPRIPAGGTTGQVLAKKSGDDFDLEWVTP